MIRLIAMLTGLSLLIGTTSCSQGGRGKSISVQCEITDLRPPDMKGKKIRAYLVDGKKNAREVASGTNKVKFNYSASTENGSPTFSMLPSGSGKETLGFSDLGKNLEKLEFRDSADQPLTYVIDDYGVTLPKKDLKVLVTIK